MSTLVLLSILNLWIIPSAQDAALRKAIEECRTSTPWIPSYRFKGCTLKYHIPLFIPLKDKY
jgi:hypothetical protein